MPKKHLYAIAFIGWMVFVTFSSLYSFKRGDMGSFNIPNGDKIVHFIFYSVAAGLGFMYLKASDQGRPVALKKLISLLISLVLFGIIIEVLQEVCTSTRSGDIFDALANSTGAICGIFTAKALFHGQRRLK